MNATVLIFLCGYKIQIQIFNCQISPGLTQPVNRVASTTVNESLSQSISIPEFPLFALTNDIKMNKRKLLYDNFNYEL